MKQIADPDIARRGHVAGVGIMQSATARSGQPRMIIDAVMPDLQHRGSAEYDPLFAATALPPLLQGSPTIR